jgi:hypothetical protein
MHPWITQAGSQSADASKPGSQPADLAGAGSDGSTGKPWCRRIFSISDRCS